MKNRNELETFPHVNYGASDSKMEKRHQPYFPPESSWDYYRRYGQVVINQTILQELRRFNVAEHTVLGEKDGTPHEYTFNLILSQPAVQVLCLRKNQNTGKLETCMVLEPRGARFATVDGKQYARFFWGLPAGLVEKGETMEEAGKREVQEEIGYKVESMQTLVKQCVHLHVSCSTETLKTFIAKVGNKTKQHLDENEYIKYHWYPVEEVEKELEDYLEGEKTFFGFDLAEITILLLQRFFTKLNRGDFEELVSN